MSMLSFRYFAVLILAAIFGCSSSGPATQHVSGTVTYNGAPVADAQIGFVPVGGEGVKPARGQTDASGNYTLKTYVTPTQDVSGATAGKFKVTVQQGLAQNQVIEYDDLKDRQDALPALYADAKSTPLEAEVTVGGANEFNFTLEDEVEGS